MINRGRGRPPQSDAPSPSSSPASVAGPAWPIRFVYCDGNGTFRMDPEAVAVLRQVKRPIGVVSVWGCARQEKSLILMQALENNSSGFQVASTHRPRTKGLWLMSAPMKRRALDGTEYNLLRLDSEGIDDYDQTGTRSMQMFSLAVLLCSMFIYNQIGRIDEAALDRLSLLTQTTKDIRVRASGGQSSTSGLGQFSPIFVWLLRDFCMDIVEDNRRIAPSDYLELALRPVEGTGGEIAAKNEIRDSIQALFPKRECFTLVRPLNNENDLQQLDQISMDKLRPEFRSGLEALTEFVFERAKPKQVGATALTGPVLVAITESYLEALNNGKVPTIPYSWPIVEQTECRRAYDSATNVYMSTFDRSKPLEEAGMREAHEEAVQKSLAAFNVTAVDAGSARKKHEELLHKFFRRAFEEYRMNAFIEADLRCSRAIRSMEESLRTACHAPDADIGNVVQVLNNLCSEYEASSHGPSKWQKLAVFLRDSWEEPIQDLAKRLIDRVGSKRSSFMLKCQAIEDQVGLLEKQLEASENYKSQYLKQYKDAISGANKLSDDYSSLRSTCGLLEERSSSLLKTLESTKQESLDWKRKYEQVLSKQKAEEDQASSEIAILKSRSSAAEARAAAAKEQAQPAQEEAEEWKRKYDIAVREAKGALEEVAIAQERTNNDTQKTEDALRAIELATKEDEMKEKVAKIEYAEQCLITIKSKLKATESKIENYDVKIMSLNKEIRALNENLATTSATAESLDRKSLELEKIVQDGLPLPLIKDLNARGVWPVPSCFKYLPGNLKLEILKWLPAVDLARIGCVSKGLRRTALDNNLWKAQFIAEFGLWSEGGEMDWKKSFGQSMEMKRANAWWEAGFYPVFVEMEKDRP